MGGNDGCANRTRYESISVTNITANLISWLCSCDIHESKLELRMKHRMVHISNNSDGFSSIIAGKFGLLVLLVGGPLSKAMHAYLTHPNIPLIEVTEQLRPTLWVLLPIPKWARPPSWIYVRSPRGLTYSKLTQLLWCLSLYLNISDAAGCANG